MADYVEAEKTLQRAIAIVREHQAEETVDGGDAMNNLGLTDRQLGRLADAEQLYRQALAVCVRIGDPEREVVVLNNLGRALVEQTRYKEAEQLYREAIGLAQRKLRPTHPMWRWA